MAQKGTPLWGASMSIRTSDLERILQRLEIPTRREGRKREFGFAE